MAMDTPKISQGVGAVKPKQAENQRTSR